MNIKWLFYGSITYLLSQWLIISLFTKIYDANTLGEYFYSLAICAPVFLFLNFKLSNIIVTQKDSLNIKKTYFVYRLILSLLGVFISLVCFLFLEKISFLVFLSVLIFKLLEHFDDFDIGYLLKESNVKEIFYLRLRRSVIYFLLVLICSAFLKLNLEKTLIYSTSIYAIIWIFFNYRKYYLIVKMDFFNDLEIIKNGFFLGTSSAIGSLSSNYTKIFIGGTLGKTALTIYACLEYGAMVISIFLNILSQYFLKKFSDNRENKIKIIKDLFLSNIIIIIIIIILSVGVYFYGEEVLHIFYNEMISKYYYCLYYLFIYMFFKSSSSLIGCAINSLNFYKFQLPITVSTILLLLLILNLLTNISIDNIFFTLILVGMFEFILCLIFFIKKIKVI